MCHVMLLMPVLALPLFWTLPPIAAAPIYAVVTVASGLLYWRIVRSHGRQPQAGAESLIGTEARVVSRLGPLRQAKYLVRSRGELWGANSPDTLQAGQAVTITALDGIRLVVASGGPLSEDVLPSDNRGGHQGG